MTSKHSVIKKSLSKKFSLFFFLKKFQNLLPIMSIGCVLHWCFKTLRRNRPILEWEGTISSYTYNGIAQMNGLAFY